jgi:hypothetical protein
MTPTLAPPLLQCDGEVILPGTIVWTRCSHTAASTGEDIDGALVLYCACCVELLYVRGHCSGASDEEREEAAEAPCYCRRPGRYCICP